MMTVRFTFLLAPLTLIGCGSGSPSSPTTIGSVPAPVYQGSAVSAIDGTPIAGVNVKVGSQTGTSDDSGNFTVRSLSEGTTTIVLSGAAIHERQRTLTIPSESAREALIPAKFDLEAFDEMFRGTGRLQRWMSAPGLVVLDKVMEYSSGYASEDYQATSEQLTDADIELMVEHFTEGLSLLTGGTFSAFSSIEIEKPASGASVKTVRTGKIVVGRYRGVQSLENTIGTAQWATNGASPEVVGGAIYLDRNFDRSNSARRLLRIHELGHALGYLHVTRRASIMNPSIGPEPTEFDRQGSIIAFQRLPGNQSPDSDLGEAARTGGIIGIGPRLREVSSVKVICGQ
jgi:hypothetical protein